MRVNDRHLSFYYEEDHDYGEIIIEPEKTALLIIDMQHVFITRPAVDEPTPEQKMHAERWEQFYRAMFLLGTDLAEDDFIQVVYGLDELRHAVEKLAAAE